MDLRNVLALAQQQQSIPGLLAMLRGGDMQGGGGGAGPPQQPQAQAPAGGGNTPQLQMAQSAMAGGGGGPQAANDASNVDPSSQAWLDLYAPGLSAHVADPSEAWRIEPGSYVRGNQIISPDKFYQDTHRPVDTQEGGGIVGGSLLPYHGFNNANAWSTKGQVGYFGQTGPWGTSWGAGGP